MKIALVRGDFISPAELANFRPLLKKHQITVFVGQNPVWDLSGENDFKFVRLPSPADLNFGRVNRYAMAVLNRLFTDAHVLFGLEENLRGFDIAHCAETYYSYTQQCLNAKDKGYVKKVVSTVWENISFNNEGIIGRKKFKLRALAKIDLFLPVTKRAKGVLIEEGCNPDKITVLNPGVDMKMFRPTHMRHKNIRLLAVSRLIPEKGILELVEIFHILKKQYSRLELAIAGVGPLRPTGVTVLGKVNYYDMPRIYTSGDIFIHYPIGSATWAEQYGMVLVEAMACGLPVVALDRGSVKEIVGQAGLVVSEKNFLRALRKVVTDRKYRLALGQQAGEFARRHYDAGLYAKELEKLYQFVLLTK